MDAPPGTWRDTTAAGNRTTSLVAAVHINAEVSARAYV